MTAIQKFYLHDAATLNSGTMPSNSPAVVSGSSVTGDATGASTARTANNVIGAATPDTKSLITATANTVFQTWGHRRFVSPPLVAQTFAIADGNWTSAWAWQESNANHNAGIIIRGYVWRPSTGARVGTQAVTFNPALVANLTETGYVTTATWDGTTVAQKGDILVFDVYSAFSQIMSTAYTDQFSYDGTVDPTNGTAATTAASYILSPSPIEFIGPPVLPKAQPLLLGLSRFSPKIWSLHNNILAPQREIAYVEVAPVQSTTTVLTTYAIPPLTSPVLDNFNTGNSFLGAPWTSRLDSVVVLNTYQAFGGNCVPTGSPGWNAAVYQGTPVLTDCEAYVTINDTVTDDHAILARVQGSLASDNLQGYGVNYNFSTGNLTIYRYGAAGITIPATLASVTPASVVSGDKIGIRCNGTTIESWLFHSGSWTLQSSVTSTTFSSGYLGIASHSLNIVFDDFGGGALVAQAETTDFVDSDTISTTTSVSSAELYVSSGAPPSGLRPLLFNLQKTFGISLVIPHRIVVTDVDYVDSTTITSITRAGTLEGIPPSTPLLYSFDIPDESPLSYGGIFKRRTGGGPPVPSPLQVLSGQLRNTVNSVGLQVAVCEGLGILIDCEAYATVAATDNNAGAVVVGRVQGDSTSTFSGYLLELSPIGRFVLTRYNNGTPTQIATTSASLTTTNGDQFAIRCLGSRIEAWGKLAADGGVWKIYTTAVDFTYFSGFIGTGMHLVSTVGSYALAVDNFGGGPINYEIYTPGVFVPESQPLLPLIAEWMGQKFLTNTQIINEAFIPAGGPVDYVESATISSVTSVQSSENTDWLDTSGSINGVSSITTTETSQFVEVATISSVTALTSVEVFAPFIQKAAVQPLLMHLRDVAGMRLIMPVPVPDFIVIVGVNYTDSATVSGVTSVQSSENTDFLDTSGSINGTSSVTSTETAQYVEASTVSSTTSLTSVETTDYVETATIASVTTISVQVETYPTPPAFITPLLVTLGRGDRLHNLILNPDYVITGVVYTDSAVVASVTSVQSSENTDWLDTSGSINGTSSITSTETSQYVESATIACTTSITSVETTDYVETSTISSITTLTVQVETYPTPPASVTPLLIKIAGKGVRLHNLILNPADSVRVNYTDSSTVAGITSIQSSENTDFLDTSGTVQGTSSITSTETAQFVESATVAGVTSISTTDTAQYVDSATGATITVVTSADVAAYVDSATVSSVTSITSVDTADYVETATIAGVTTVTTADQYIPFTTAPLTITPQPLLIALARHGLLHNNRLNPADSVRVNYVDSATITSVTATTSTETGDWVDTAGTISGTSTVTSTETAQYVDPATVASTTSLSTTETSTYVDQNIGATVTVVISTETTDYVETALVTSITSLQSNEQYAPLGIITQFAPIPLLIKFGHGTKLHNNRLTFADSVRVNYVESATISTSTSPTSTETTDFVDGVPAACKTTITFTEIPSGTDSLTVNGTTTLTSTETAQYVESGLLRTVTSVFSFEDYTPIITAYSDLYIIGAQSRWAITEAMPRWSISSTRQRWQLMAHSPRWAVQGVKRRWAGWSH